MAESPATFAAPDTICLCKWSTTTAGAVSVRQYWTKLCGPKSNLQSNFLQKPHVGRCDIDHSWPIAGKASSHSPMFTSETYSPSFPEHCSVACQSGYGRKYSGTPCLTTTNPSITPHCPEGPLLVIPVPTSYLQNQRTTAESSAAVTNSGHGGKSCLLLPKHGTFWPKKERRSTCSTPPSQPEPLQSAFSHGEAEIGAMNQTFLTK